MNRIDWDFIISTSQITDKKDNSIFIRKKVVNISISTSPSSEDQK